MKACSPSIPLPAGNGQSPMVLHLVPVRRAASDIFNAAALLLGLGAAVAGARAGAFGTAGGDRVYSGYIV